MFDGAGALVDIESAAVNTSLPVAEIRRTATSICLGCRDGLLSYTSAYTASVSPTGKSRRLVTAPGSCFAVSGSGSAVGVCCAATDVSSNPLIARSSLRKSGTIKS